MAIVGFGTYNASTTPGTGNKIMNNTFKDFYQYGVYGYYQNSLEVSQNDISRATRTGVTTFYGVYANNCVGTTVTKNRIHNSHDVASSQTADAYGIYHTASDGTAANLNLVANNLIYEMNSTDGAVYGFYNSGSDYTRYYHNTVAINNQSATGTDIVRAFYQTTTASNIDLKNNIFYINHSSTGDKHGLYFNTTATTFTSDNNVVFASGGGTKYFGRSSSTNRITRAAWQTATSQDANSLDVDPLLNSSYQPQSGTIDNQGQNLLTSVPDDIAGTTHTTAPDPEI